MSSRSGKDRWHLHSTPIKSLSARNSEPFCAGDHRFYASLSGFRSAQSRFLAVFMISELQIWSGRISDNGSFLSDVSMV
ncbi:hypothetical protein CEXT_660231 [Caerostris extrusa]|uniref:Uncharacterized protein n=1 Tax=Caerostris extrusa TaxID=172846 RepID=A0AAV4XU25_CAEEX|nr:hypothetical protein CEXT_660231 [Caerostris extrusa]